MLVRRVTQAQIEEAASRTGVCLTPIRAAGSSAFRFRIVPDPKTRATNSACARYQRLSSPVYHGGRRVHAVCFHGHYQFFLHLFELSPGAKIRTAMHKWDSMAQLEAEAWEVETTNVGAPIYPVPYGELCLC